MPKAFFWESNSLDVDGRIWPSRSLAWGFGRQEIHVKGVEDELQELGDEARIRRVPREPQPGPVEQPPQVLQAVALALVAVELELQADGGTDLLEHEEPAGVRRDEGQAAAGLQHAADLGQGAGVVVDVLEIIKADDLVECAVLEGQGRDAHLDEIVAEDALAGLEVGEIEVGRDPRPALLAQEKAEDALGAAEVQDEVRRPDVDMLADEVELFLFLERAFDDLQLPGGDGHGRIILRGAANMVLSLLSPSTCRAIEKSESDFPPGCANRRPGLTARRTMHYIYPRENDEIQDDHRRSLGDQLLPGL